MTPSTDAARGESAWRALAVLLAISALWALALSPWTQPQPRGADTLALTQMEFVAVADTAPPTDAPPPAEAAPPPAGATAVALPHHWPAATPTPAWRTLWWRAALAPARTGGEQRLLLPRWQGPGRLAVYGDGRLLFHTRGDLYWNATNQPLWVALGGPGAAGRPAELLLRLDAPARAGGALSAGWVGPAADLQPLHARRVLLQNALPRALDTITLALALLGLVLWLRQRREPLYLMFAAFAACWVLRGLRYHVDGDPLPLPSAWFGWVSASSGNLLVLLWTAFIARLVPTTPRWLLRALAGLAVVSAVVTLPPLAAVPHIAFLKAQTYALTIAAGTPAGLYVAWLAWRQPGVEGRIATAVGLLHIPVAWHDLALAALWLDPADYFWWPLSTTLRVSTFAYILLRRHLAAVDEVARSHERLAERLAQREAELNASHEALRAVREREALAGERQRLMQDLHDGLGSQLMSALRVAESGRLAPEQMRAVLRECLDDLKLTVDSLEPLEADLTLLLATLRYRLTPRLQAAGLQVRWTMAELPPLAWLEPRNALHVLRILQEAVANVMQHAGATELRFITTCEGPGVAVMLEDDGRGFDGPDGASPRHGLGHMLRRARALGGELSWQRLPRGTRMRLWLPLQTQAAVRQA